MNKIYDAILGRVFITFFSNQVESIYSSLKKIIGQMSSFKFLLGGGSTPPQNGEVKALSVSVPPMIFVNAMTP